MRNIVLFLACLGLGACKKEKESTQAVRQDITESIYASGQVLAKDQYQAFANAAGTIEEILVQEGQEVQIGSPLFRLSNQNPALGAENAALLADYNQVGKQSDRLKEAQEQVELSQQKYMLDSSLLKRQQNLWAQQVGTRVELEQRQLAAQQSKTAWRSAMIRLNELNKQIRLNAQQSQKNLAIARSSLGDFIIKSKINGKVFKVLKKKGEMVNPQIPLAILGSDKAHYLSLQVDENDVFQVQKEQLVYVNMAAYPNQVFEARVKQIIPLVNERSKTFEVQAAFSKAPAQLYPNVSVEANILLRKKSSALLIPRSYVLNDSFVLDQEGKKIPVKLGLRDFQMVEVLDGIQEKQVIYKP